jgi:hypothetical protein
MAFKDRSSLLKTVWTGRKNLRHNSRQHMSIWLNKKTMRFVVLKTHGSRLNLSFRRLIKSFNV